MNNFCGKCGKKVDTATGLCFDCDREKIDSMVAKNDAANILNQDEPKSKPLTTVVTVLLCVCLFFTSLLAVFIYDARNAVTEENFEKMIDNLYMSDFLIQAQITTEDDLEEFYNYMKNDYNIVMTDSRLNSFIKNSTIKDFIADKTDDFFVDFFDNEDAEITITRSQVFDLIQENSDVIEEKFDTELSIQQVSNITNYIFGEDREADKLVLISSDILKDEAPAMYNTLKVGLSYITMVIFIILSIISIVLLIKNNLAQATLGIGIDFTVLGGSIAVFLGLMTWITYLWEMICANSFVGVMIGSIWMVNYLNKILLLLIGVAVLVARKFLIKYRAKKLAQAGLENI